MISKYLNFHQTIEIFHDFSPRNVKDANHLFPNVDMTFVVEKSIYDASLVQLRFEDGLKNIYHTLDLSSVLTDLLAIYK